MVAAAMRGKVSAVSGQDRLARRASVLTRLARWYRFQADRAHGARAEALRATARELEAEALRLAPLPRRADGLVADHTT
jgi:hypothetical protein